MLRTAAGAAVVTFVALLCAPAASADPFDGAPPAGSAKAVIDDLTARGYNTFTTVYVDVSCPNHDDSVSGGIGVTIG